MVIDPIISRHLRPHQKEGISFLYECVMGYRDFEGLGAILADEMGLGKSLQAIGVLWTLLSKFIDSESLVCFLMFQSKLLTLARCRW